MPSLILAPNPSLSPNPDPIPNPYQMAASYPREFLQLIARMPLQPAPELLGGKGTHTNPIPNRDPRHKTSPNPDPNPNQARTHTTS